MTTKLEDRCALCPELLADGYGKCDHRRCMACMVMEAARRPVATWEARGREYAGKY